MVASRYPTTQYIDEFATDESGTFTLPEKLQIGTYYLEEVNAPDGYLKGQRMKFDITSGHDWSQPFTIQYANTPAKGKIKIVKTDSETAEPVEGAVYEIYADGDIKTGDNTIRNTSGELINTVTTDDTGTALSKELYLGNYTVKEKETRPINNRLAVYKIFPISNILDCPISNILILKKFFKRIIITLQIDK